MGGITIFVSVLRRVIGASARLLGSALTVRERLLVAVAFSPVATVQAAVAAARDAHRRHWTRGRASSSSPGHR